MLKNYSKESFISLRREFIERRFGFLNDTQKSAVFQTEGPLLLLAGAGSGKTTVIINRIANIITFGNAYNSDEVPPEITDMDYEILEQYLRTEDELLRESAESVCGQNVAKPRSILAITFTNKAASELRERLSKVCGEKANDILAATFHSACVRILRRDIDRLGYTSSFTIYDADDSLRVIKDVMAELDIDTKAFPPKSVQNMISRAKDSMISPEKYAEKVCGLREEKTAEVYKKYQARLKGSNAVDFDDIIMLTVRLLSENRDVLDHYHRRFEYVMIDEYQDTNHAQYLLAALLAEGSGNLCVVGDDDQSIYRFRGATIENILDFENQFKNAETIRLEYNYRSTTGILDVANSVIKNNRGRKGKNLWTDKNDSSLPTVFCARDERDEANYICEEILSQKVKGKNLSDCAVLYRINAQSMQLETAFKKNAIPYRMFGGQKFFERSEIKDILSYLCLISNRTDTLRLKRIINVPARKIGAKTVEIVEQLAQRENTFAFDIVSRAGDFKELGTGATSALLGFAEIINTLVDKSEKLPLVELFDLLLEKTGYVAELQAKDDFESRGRIENIMELKSNIVDYEARAGSSLSGFLEEISLFTDLDNYNADEDSVTMMTIHSAKGLEFPTVFVTGLEEGMFPSLRSMDFNDEIEEERRLFYVATTRAKETLHMTYAKSRMMFGQTKYGRISRFLSEIPPGLVVEKASEPARTAFSDFGGYYGAKSERASFDFATERPAREKSSVSFGNSSFAKKADSTPTLALNPGDRISHKAFKEGLVISVTPVAGDSLLEIAFDNVGTKKLLLKTAAKFITKI